MNKSRFFQAVFINGDTCTATGPEFDTMPEALKQAKACDDQIDNMHEGIIVSLYSRNCNGHACCIADFDLGGKPLDVCRRDEEPQQGDTDATGDLLSTVGPVCMDFGNDNRHAAYYEKNSEDLGGFPGIWHLITQAAAVLHAQICKMEADAEYDFIETVERLINYIYDHNVTCETDLTPEILHEEIIVKF